MHRLLRDCVQGLVVLFKVNPDKKENVKIIAVLYGIAVAAGLILEMFGV